MQAVERPIPGSEPGISACVQRVFSCRVAADSSAYRSIGREREGRGGHARIGSREGTGTSAAPVSGRHSVPCRGPVPSLQLIRPASPWAGKHALSTPGRMCWPGGFGPRTPPRRPPRAPSRSVAQSTHPRPPVHSGCPQGVSPHPPHPVWTGGGLNGRGYGLAWGPQPPGARPRRGRTPGRLT